MSFHSRFWRITLVSLGVLLFAGYFAFSTFVFSPTEDDYDFDVSTLVPRGIDLFVAKARLADDFDELPRLAAQSRLEQLAGWRTFFASPEYLKLSEQNDLEAKLAGLEQLKQDLRGFDLLEIFGGRDVALACKLTSQRIDDLDWAVYGRVGWMGKFAMAMCRYPGLSGLAERGIAVDQREGWFELSGGALRNPIHLVRIQDVVIAASSAEFAAKALELERLGGQDSFGQSAAYHDHIDKAVRTPRRDELEVYADWRKLAPAIGFDSPWPDPSSEFELVKFAAGLFQLGSVKTLSGVVGFEQGLQMQLHGDLTSESMTPMQARLYRRRGAEKSFIGQDAARFARPDAAVFAVIQAGLGDLIREYLLATEPALRQNLEDSLRNTGEFRLTDEAQTHTEALIGEIDALFRDRVVLILRANDYPYDPVKDPPRDGTPAAAWSLILWTDGSEKSRKRLDEIHQILVRHQVSFGIKGRDAGARGVFNNEVNGYWIWEFWSQFVPGTGHISTCVINDMYVVSNQFQMVGEVLANFISRGSDSRRQSLADRVEFQSLLDASLPQANLACWVDPRSLAKLLGQQIDFQIRDEVSAGIDWKTENPKLERQLLQDEFDARTRDSLDPDDSLRFEALFKERQLARENQVLAGSESNLRAAYQRKLDYLESLSAALLLIALDPKSIDLSLRTFIPLPD